MSENIDQVAVPEDDIVADAIPTQESADVVQESDTALDEAGSPGDGEAAPDEVDTVQDNSRVAEDEEADVGNDDPAAS